MWPLQIGIGSILIMCHQLPYVLPLLTSLTPWHPGGSSRSRSHIPAFHARPGILYSNFFFIHICNFRFDFEFLCLYLHVCMYVCMYIYICMYVHTYNHICIHIYSYVSLCYSCMHGRLYIITNTRTRKMSVCTIKPKIGTISEWYTRKMRNSNITSHLTNEPFVMISFFSFFFLW